jgi:CDGSH-type Zn-finger protein
MTKPGAQSDGSEPRITATPNGPYRLTGVRRIVWRQPVETAAGEPIAWAEGEVLADSEQEYWLCRCGQSANKPFCDSSHRRVGFEAEDAADTGPRAERAKTFGTGETVLEDDRSVCAHAGFCGTKLTNAWKLSARGDLGTAERSQLVAMAAHCPSGALTLRLEGKDVEPSMPAEIALMPDGPLLVTGGVVVECSDGTVLEKRNRMTLCRCGASASKPLCDGSHAETGFRHSPLA